MASIRRDNLKQPSIDAIARLAAMLPLVVALACGGNNTLPAADASANSSADSVTGDAPTSADLAGTTDGVDVVPEPNFVIAGRPFVHVFRATFATVDLAPIGYRLITGPSSSTLSDEGVFSWTPPEDISAQSIEVTIEATKGSEKVQQTITLQVFSIREIAAANVSATGGRIELSATGTSLDGLAIVIPPDTDSGSENVRVLALFGGNLQLAGFSSLAQPFLVAGTTRAIRLEVSTELRAQLQQVGAEVKPLAVVAYAAPTQAGYEPVATQIVAGSCCADKQVPGGSIATAVDAGAILQILENQARCYCLEQPPFRIRYWASKAVDDANAAEATMRFVATAADQAKATLEGAGCTPMGDDDLDIYIYPFPGTNVWALGATATDGQTVVFNRDRYEAIDSRSTDEQTLLRTVVYHEMTHVFHDRMVGIDRVAVDMADGAWSVEGLAVFNEDEIEDTNQYLSTFPWQAFGPFVANGGLREGISRSRLHPYMQSAFFKALKKTANFKTCQYLQLRTQASSAYETLDSMLGSAENRHDLYAQFVATWLVPELWPLPGRIDDDALIPDTVNTSTLDQHTLPAAGKKDYRLGLSAGGIAARFTGGPVSQVVAITLAEPDKDARGLVFDSQGNLIDKLEAGKETLLSAGTTTFSVAIAIDQGPAAEGLGLLHDVSVHINTCCTPWVYHSAAYVTPSMPSDKCKHLAGPPDKASYDEAWQETLGLVSCEFDLCKVDVVTEDDWKSIGWPQEVKQFKLKGYKPNSQGQCVNEWVFFTAMQRDRDCKC